MKVLVTGSSGFIGGYLVQHLLDEGYHVVGIDNHSKYGRVARAHDDHPNYEFHEGDVKDVKFLKEIMSDCDQVVAGAAMIGGISYFHKYAYSLLAENERILAATFDAAIWAFQNRGLKKINVISSSMVFESTSVFPTPEGEQLTSPPPMSTYGFQKLSSEYFAKGAWEQYGLPYTIIRPFNCVGVGESRAKGGEEVASGNISLAMTHVVPDLIQKIARNQDPLHILGDGQQVRAYTYAGDIARGIRACIEREEATNEDFNISTPRATTAAELAQIIWNKMRPGKPLSLIHDEPFKYDVQYRLPDVSKAAKMLDFRADTPLEEMLDEVIPWVEAQIKLGTI